MSEETNTTWFRHRFDGSLHEVENGSEAYRRCVSEVTQVDIDAGEVPQMVFEPVTPGDLRKAQSNPEKIPGYSAGAPSRAARRRQPIVMAAPAPAESTGPSEEEIQARIDAAAEAAAIKATEAVLAQLAELGTAPAPAENTGNPAAVEPDPGAAATGDDKTTAGKPAAANPKGK